MGIDKHSPKSAESNGFLGKAVRSIAEKVPSAAIGRRTKSDPAAKSSTEPAESATAEATLNTTASNSVAHRRGSNYARFLKALEHDPVILKEISLGKRIGFYRIRKDLGAGNFSKVKMATNSVTKDIVALKIIDKTKLDQKAHKLLSQEIENMQLLFHSRICMLYEVIETLSQLTLVLEYADSGDLYSKVMEEGRLLETEAKNYYVQIVDAVHYMHRNRIIHRDIKSENIYLHDNAKKVKIGDLGFSTRVVSLDQRLTTFCGSPPYAAPELFSDDFYVGTYVDIWALGILLYFLVCGRTPFRAENVPDLKAAILKGDFRMPEQLTPECQELISSILIVKAEDRATMAYVQTHPWLSDITCSASISMSSEEAPPKETHLFVPVRLLPGSATNSPRGLMHLVSEDMKRACASQIAEEFGINEEEVTRIAITEEKIRHPITGIYRISLHEAAKGTRNRAQKKVTIRSPPQSVIERRPTDEFRVVNKTWSSRLCTIL